MYRTQIQLREDQARKLKEQASEWNQSVAALIRQAVDDYLQDVERISLEERIERAAATVGQFRSGSADTAADHDRYLGKAFADDDIRR